MDTINEFHAVKYTEPKRGEIAVYRNKIAAFHGLGKFYDPA